MFVPNAPVGKMSQKKPHTFFAGMAQFLEAKRDFNFELSTASEVVTLTNDILQMFAEVENSMLTQKTVKGIENGFFVANTLSMGRKEGETDLGAKNKYFTYFLLSTSGEEFHNMFLKFYHEFDTDCDYTLSQFEFKEMLNFFCKKENIGREKIEKVFKKLFPINFKSWHKLDKILDKNEDHELGLNLSNGVFQQMKANDKQSNGLLQNKKPVVEYLKMLPLLTALYSQLIAVRISKRKENLEMTRGVDDLGDKIRLSESSLCDKFERLGLVYDKDDPVILTYRDIENALILFKNYYTSNFGQQQLNLVLSDIQQKYKYSKKRGDFIKPPLFDQKFLTYLAFKVSIHGICHFIKNSQEETDRHAIIQEFIYWNIVVHANKFNRQDLSRKFKNFASKNPGKSIDQLFSQFIVKIIPLIPRQMGQNILDNYSQRSYGALDVADFANHIYDLLVEQAETKLQSYIQSTFEKITKQTEQWSKADTRRQSVFDKTKHMSKISQESEALSKLTGKNHISALKGDVYPDGSYVDPRQEYNINDLSIERGATRGPSVMTGYRAEGEIGRAPNEYENSHIHHSRSIAKNSEIPSMSGMDGRRESVIKPERIPLFETLDAPKESFHFDRRSAKEKSLTNLDQSQTRILTDREGLYYDKSQPHPDYLNSCFIMETFLHNFLYEKSFGGGVKKKKEPTTRKMSAYGRRASRRPTNMGNVPELDPQDISPDASPERNTTQGFASTNSFNAYAQSAQARRTYQPSQQQDVETPKYRRARIPTEFKFKRNSFDALKDELGDYEDFNPDQIFFTKKDMTLNDREKCTCNMF